MESVYPSLSVSPAEESAKPNLDSVKPSVSSIGAVVESNLRNMLLTSEQKVFGAIKWIVTLTENFDSSRQHLQHRSVGEII